MIFINGRFDLLHPGHVALIQHAASLKDSGHGEELVVAVNGAWRDQLFCCADRMTMVSAIRGVNRVILMEAPHPADLIRAMRPRIIVKGSDYKDKILPEADAILEVGAEVVFVPRSGHSSSLYKNAMRA